MKKSNFCKLKTSLSSNFIHNSQTFWEILSRAFLCFCCKFSMTIKFYLAVNIDKPKFVAVLVFVGTTDSVIAKISSFENVL